MAKMDVSAGRGLGYCARLAWQATPASKAARRPGPIQRPLGAEGETVTPPQNASAEEMRKKNMQKKRKLEKLKEKNASKN